MSSQNSNLSFEPVLSKEQAEKAMGECANWNISERIAIVVLTKTPEQLITMVDTNPESFAEIAELVGEYIQHLKQSLELYEASFARLVTVGSEVLGIDLFDDEQGEQSA